VIALVAAGAVALAGCGSAARRPPPGPPGRLELGLPLRDAVAQLFAVGFAGKDPRAPLVARLRTRAWGVVVLEPPNAVAEVRRYTLTPTQPSSYALGREAILALRDKARAKGWGMRFFHDKLLAAGSLPPKLLARDVEL